MKANRPQSHSDLEPKAPELLQNLKWLQIHGSKYPIPIFIAVFVVICWISFSYIGPRIADALFTKHNPNRFVSETDQPKVIEDEKAKPISAPKANSISKPDTPYSHNNSNILTTGETPIEIKKVLSDVFGNSREQRAKDLYINRWLPQSGWKGIVAQVPSRLDSDWWISVDFDEGGLKQYYSMNYVLLITKQDAAGLRPGEKIQMNGKISKADESFVVLNNGSFKVLTTKK